MIYRKIINLIKRLLPEYFHVIIKAIIFPNRVVAITPTFNKDGLVTNHVVDFMNDSRFKDALNEGKKYTRERVDDYRLYIGCALSEHAAKLEGDFVECGVFLGTMSKTIINYINFNSLDKKFWLFDTFTGIPLENLIEDDGRELYFYDDTGKYGRTDSESSSSTNIIDLVRDKFDGDKVMIVEGKVPDVLIKSTCNKIAFIHIDMNNAYPEVEAIKYFWDKIVPSGIILLDDYAYSTEYKMQKNMIDDLGKDLNFSVITLPTGQGLIIKY